MFPPSENHAVFTEVWGKPDSSESRVPFEFVAENKEEKSHSLGDFFVLKEMVVVKLLKTLVFHCGFDRYLTSKISQTE